MLSRTTGSKRDSGQAGTSSGSVPKTSNVDPVYDSDEDEEDEDFEDVGSDYESDDSEAKKSRKSTKSSKKKPAKGFAGLEDLEGVDADELSLLRQDAVEQFGADVLKEEEEEIEEKVCPLRTRRVNAAYQAMMQDLETDSELKPMEFLKQSPNENEATTPEYVLPESPKKVPTLDEARSASAKGNIRDFLTALNKSTANNRPSSRLGLNTVVSLLGPSEKVLCKSPSSGYQARKRGRIPGLDISELPKRARRMYEPVLNNEDLLVAASVARSIATNRKIQVKKKVMFAGKEVEVTQLVDHSEFKKKDILGNLQNKTSISSGSTVTFDITTNPGAEAPASAPRTEDAAIRRPSSNISNVLASLDKKETLSTLEMTNLDWETYKAREGLEEDFTAAARGSGFVEKQALLSRLGNRQEDIAKQKRAEERARRDLASGR